MLCVLCVQDPSVLRDNGDIISINRTSQAECDARDKGSHGPTHKQIRTLMCDQKYKKCTYIAAGLMESYF
jgi:hypothetical protein